MMITNVISTS